MKEHKNNNKTRQWLWFIGLWCLGLISVGLISLLIKAVFLLGS